MQTHCTLSIAAMPRFSSLFSALLIAHFLPSFSLAANVNVQFKVANNDISPDGFKRNAILVNDQSPGTLITAKKNDVLHINVTNQLTNTKMRRSTSIHVHIYLLMIFFTNICIVARSCMLSQFLELILLSQITSFNLEQRLKVGTFIIKCILVY